MHVHRCPIPDRSPSAMFKRLSLTQRLLAGTAFAVTLAFGTLLAITVQQSRQGAVEQAELGMRTQLDLVVTMLDYAQEALKTRARDQLTLLEHELPGKASLLLRPHEVSTCGVFDPGILEVAHYPLG